MDPQLETSEIKEVKKPILSATSIFILFVFLTLGFISFLFLGSKQASQTTAVNETQDWKTYRNEEYGFEFKYPSSLSLDNNSYWLMNKNGEPVAQIATQLRFIELGTLEGHIKSNAGRENSRSGGEEPKSVENTLFKKVADQSEAIGYISQWKINWADQSYEMETRADFEHESRVYPSELGDYRIVASLFTFGQENAENIKLLESITSTFRFIK